MRQYIGARYTTKIYENSLDPSSAEWESGVTYEPLTLVTYNNSSYLSKKAVPGSVGDPAANPSYWVVTGAYNGQILSLQNQIDAINALIGSGTLDNGESTLIDSINKIFNTTPLKTNKFIIFGDSWCNASGNYPWVENLATRTGATIHNYSSGGIGYLLSDSIGDKVTAALNDVANGLYDPLEIESIIFEGGLNDAIAASITAVGPLAQEMIDQAHRCEAVFKNAHITFVFNCKQGGSATVLTGVNFRGFAIELCRIMETYYPIYHTLDWFAYSEYAADRGHIVADNRTMQGNMWRIFNGLAPIGNRSYKGNFTTDIGGVATIESDFYGSRLIVRCSGVGVTAGAHEIQLPTNFLMDDYNDAWGKGIKSDGTVEAIAFFIDYANNKLTFTPGNTVNIRETLIFESK